MSHNMQVLDVRYLLIKSSQLMEVRSKQTKGMDF